MKQNYKAEDHTFVICAYGESPYLEECVKSVLTQKMKTNVLIATSTPNKLIGDIAERYNIELYVNRDKSRKSDIASDWNFALSVAHTSLVTITHQDDLYFSGYASKIIAGMNNAKRPLIAFTDYSELRNGEFVVDNQLLKIKRYMLMPLRIKKLWTSRFVRRRILSFGSAICCPSVTFNMDILQRNLFVSGYRSDIDWQAWEKISRIEGSFVYCPDILMSHRIHPDSATTAIIADNDRSKEDFEMYCKFWPRPIARIIEHYYRKGESQNKLDD